MENIKPIQEQRLAFRLSIQLKFKFKISSPTKAELSDVVTSSETRNISSSGMLFENNEELPLDTEIDIFLDLPGVPVEVIKFKGKVVRIEKVANGKYDIGIKFTDISVSQRDQINKRIERMDIIKLLEKINPKEVSDLHLIINSPAMIRTYGLLKPLDDKPLAAEEIKYMIYSILSDEQKKHLEGDKGLDFAFCPSANLRFRVSIYQQRGSIEAVFRTIASEIKLRADLGLPDVIEDLAKMKSGIVIIAGPTGSGKTTTITTMIDIINRERGGVILSLEKPIEYLHKNIKGIVKQREVGSDVESFAGGLKASLRQDPDVIVVGEVLDADTIETTIQAAETGHLVITSIHATDTLQVFDRITSFFPKDQWGFICARLSHSLKAVIVQNLLPHKDGKSRVMATEVCTINTAMKRIIYTGEFTQLYSVMQTGSQFKMHLMSASVERLFEQNLISAEIYDAYRRKDDLT